MQVGPAGNSSAGKCADNTFPQSAQARVFASSAARACAARTAGQVYCQVPVGPLCVCVYVYLYFCNMYI